MLAHMEYSPESDWFRTSNHIINLKCLRAIFFHLLLLSYHICEQRTVDRVDSSKQQACFARPARTYVCRYLIMVSSFVLVLCRTHVLAWAIIDEPDVYACCICLYGAQPLSAAGWLFTLLIWARMKKNSKKKKRNKREHIKNHLLLACARMRSHARVNTNHGRRN